MPVLRNISIFSQSVLLVAPQAEILDRPLHFHGADTSGPQYSSIDSRGQYYRLPGPIQ